VRSLQQNQTHQIEHESLLTAIANRVNASLDLQVILDTTVAEIRQFLNTDRVIAYKFEPDWSGVVVAESVTQSCNSLIGRVLIDPYFGEAMVEPYKNGRIQVTDNIYLGLTECHTNFLETLQVKALIVVPILQEGQLWGLLAAQECLRSRFWDRSSVTLLQQLATHVGIAIRQAHTTAQMRQLNQELENKILERTKALITSETRLNLIVSNVSDGILIVDQDGKIVFANPSAAKIFDLSIAEIIGQSIGIPNSLSRQFEINHLKKDGKIGASVLQFVLIEWNNHPAYLISLHDITERQEAEAKLSESNQQLEISNQELARATRLKDEFLANMSHELRTPLNAILGMTEGLQEGVFGAVNEKQIKALQTVERSGSHLLSLINDILDVAKIESGQIELDYALTDVAALCQSSLAFIKQQSVKKRIQLEIKLPQKLSELLIDERRIRQVLINLLRNEK
jgi:signal transduction histidine kinase